jgi:hypothetical protein
MERTLHGPLEKRKLFDGSLGCYSGRKFHINLKPGSDIYYCKKLYSIPVEKLNLAKKELESDNAKLGFSRRYVSPNGHAHAH